MGLATLCPYVDEAESSLNYFNALLFHRPIGVIAAPDLIRRHGRQLRVR